MMMDIDKKELLEQIGDPSVIDRELTQFSKSARVLSADPPRLMDKYDKRWVAVYRGKVRATGKTLRELLAQVDQKELPRGHLIARFINRNRRTMIL